MDHVFSNGVSTTLPFTNPTMTPERPAHERQYGSGAELAGEQSVLCGRSSAPLDVTKNAHAELHHEVLAQFLGDLECVSGVIALSNHHYTGTLPAAACARILAANSSRSVRISGTRTSSAPPATPTARAMNPRVRPMTSTKNSL